MFNVKIFDVITETATFLKIFEKFEKVLKNFVRRIRHVDIIATDLQSKVNQLRTCTMIVQRIARNRDLQIRREDQDQEKIDI